MEGVLVRLTGSAASEPTRSRGRFLRQQTATLSVNSRQFLIFLPQPSYLPSKS